MKNSNYTNKNFNEFDGFDMRTNITDKYNISVLLYKNNILNTLTNENINIYKKLDYVNDYNKIFNDKKCHNINACNLIKKWKSDFYT
jgi:hypothetical protein